MPAFCIFYKFRWGNRWGRYRGQQAFNYGRVQAKGIWKVGGTFFIIE